MGQKMKMFTWWTEPCPKFLDSHWWDLPPLNWSDESAADEGACDISWKCAIRPCIDSKYPHEVVYAEFKSGQDKCGKLQVFDRMFRDLILHRRYLQEIFYSILYHYYRGMLQTYRYSMYCQTPIRATLRPGDPERPPSHFAIAVGKNSVDKTWTRYETHLYSWCAAETRHCRERRNYVKRGRYTRSMRSQRAYFVDTKGCQIILAESSNNRWEERKFCDWWWVRMSAYRLK